MAPIELDLRRDLPKVRAALDDLMVTSECRYTAPCAIGVMMTPEQRATIPKGADGDYIGSLIDQGEVAAPPEQIVDLGLLQDTFDCSRRQFPIVLAELEAKYLAA